MSIKTTGPNRGLNTLTIAAIATLGLAGCGAADGTADASGEETYTFTLATGALDDTTHSAVEQRYLDLVEERSDGKIEFDRTSFEALCSMQEIVECLRDGRADIGTTPPDYTPHLFPTHTVVGVSFLNNDLQATTAAMYDTHVNYEPAATMLEQNNLRYISVWPAGRMVIGSQEPVDTYEDLNGLRARATGPITESSLETAGVNVNAVTAAETYEAMQRGVIDSVAASLDFGVDYQIVEQAPYWTDPGMGQYAGYGMWWNTDAYESLPADLQSVVDEVTEEMNFGGESIATYNEQMNKVCDGMLESDVEGFTRWDEDETQKWRADVGADAEELWLEIVASYGFEEGEEYLEEYKAAYAEYESDDNPVDAAIACVDEWEEQNN